MQKLESGLRDAVAGASNVCTEVDVNELAQSVDQIALAAAQLGNKKAAACYLNASFHDIVGTPSDAEFERYRKFTTDLIDASLKQGNWDVVSVMAFAYGPGRKHGLYAQLVQADPAKEYRYVKLQQLGAIGDMRSAKEEQVNSILASGNLSEDDVREGDEWAESIFARYFHEPFKTDQPPDCFEPSIEGN